MKVPYIFWLIGAVSTLAYTTGTIVVMIGAPVSDCNPITWFTALSFLGWVYLIAWLCYEAGKAKPR